MPPSRRRVLHTMASGIPVGLAGCTSLMSSRDTTGTPPSDSPTKTPSPTPAPPETPTPWGTDLPALAPTWTASPFSSQAGDLLLFDGTLYVTAKGLFGYALDADSGDVEWETDLGDSFVGPPGDHAGSLDRFGQTLFVTTRTDATPKQYVHALDIDTGEKRWTFGAREFLSVAGVVDDVAYVSGNYIETTEPGPHDDPAGEGRIRALSLADGTVRWQLTVPNLIRYYGTVVADHGVYAADGPVLRAVSLEGEERWSVAGGSEHYPSIAGSSILFEGAVSNTLVAYAAETGDQEWSVPLMENWQVVVTPERIYADSRDIVALTHDGTEVWRNRQRGFIREFLLPSDTLYVERGTAIAALSPTDGTERWSFDPADLKYVNARAVVDAGLVVEPGIGRSNEYILLDADTGDPRGRIATDSRFYRTISRGNRLYIGSDGRVYAFDVGRAV